MSAENSSLDGYVTATVSGCCLMSCLWPLPLSLLIPLLALSISGALAGSQSGKTSQTITIADCGQLS